MSLLLTFSVFLPLLGAVIVWILASEGKAAARSTALVTSLLTLGLVAKLVLSEPAPAVESAWIAAATGGAVDVRFSLALDGLGVWLYALSALLTVTAVLISWHEIQDRAPDFYALLLLLETGLLGVFTAQDILLFYVFFEFTLIPLFFLIGVWGHEERRYAAIKFFLYTLAGSMFTFLGLLAIVLWHREHDPAGRLTFHIPTLLEGLRAHPLDAGRQMWIFLALFAGFAIKVPLFPLHTWLPLAHVQAPTAGSVALAGVLLKIGTFGFLRFSIPMLPEASVAAMPWILGLSVAGILYGALVALAQSDMKRLIAYSSVSHLGFCMLGLFALDGLGLAGGALQMVNHGLATGGLFAVVGMLYERYHTREIARLGGLARRLPRLAFCMLVFTFASIGLPGTNGFVGEFLILVGMFQRAFVDPPPAQAFAWQVLAVLAVFGVVLGAWYMLWLMERVFFGPLKEPGAHGGAGEGHAPAAAHAADPHGHGGGHGHAAPLLASGAGDLGLRELLALTPIVVFIFWIGLFPQPFLARMQPELDAIAARVAPALAAAQTAAAEPTARDVARSEGEHTRVD